ncbi:MAG: pirin family protein [Anaerolineaceae bacterium]|nr:pirin family protein [Anaerolineaceae bacterium]
MAVDIPLLRSAIEPGFVQDTSVQHFSASTFPTIHPIHWLHSHFAVGGWSPLQRLSGMLTAHMTRIAPHNGFTWHPHRGLEIYTWVLEGELYHEDTTGGRGIIKAGELQRMFAGDYIEHQELNLSDDPTRVIQIWFIADQEHRGLEPHYQQLNKDALPVRRVGDADVYSLVGEDSPIEQHITARLTATWVDGSGTTTIEAPQAGEDLFLYITDGAGTAELPQGEVALSQYDVLLARPDMPQIALTSSADKPLRYMSYYLRPFLRL